MNWGFAVGFLAGVLSVSGVYLRARPRFVVWRMTVWALRVGRHSDELQMAIGTADRLAERVAEDALNQALMKYSKWKRRA